MLFKDLLYYQLACGKDYERRAASAIRSLLGVDRIGFVVGGSGTSGERRTTSPCSGAHRF